jgi:steroid 5-alpha reductase family enzyme
MMTLAPVNFLSASLVSGYDAGFQNLVSAWLNLAICVVILTFVASELTRNYSQVDKLWSLMPIAYSWITVASFPSPRMYIMAFLVTFWGMRLSYNFYRKGGYSLIPWKGEEDYRWKILRETPALKGRLRFGLFNLLFISFYQNLLILLFSTPLLLAALYPDAPLTVTDIIAAALMLVFIITETIADNQMYRFQEEKRSGIPGDPANDGPTVKGFLTGGLWKYVRHPNYASEQAIWICFYLFGVAASGKWINFTMAGPVLLVILFIGSSVMTEKVSSSKYPEYSVYQKEVPKFIPRIFRRR